MSVGSDRMLRGRLEQFLFATFDSKRATLFAWVQPAIDRFPLFVSHYVLLSHKQSHVRVVSFVFVFFRGLESCGRLEGRNHEITRTSISKKHEGYT